MNKKTIDYKTRGRKNRERGARFERKVRKDLEKQSWVIDRWGNNVEFQKTITIPAIENTSFDAFDKKRFETGKLIPAKRKYNPFKKVMAIGTGFPDFICFKTILYRLENFRYIYEIIGVECKSTGYLSKEEKEKCQWLLDKEVFSKILIASKGDKRGSIIYKEFTENKK